MTITRLGRAFVSYAVVAVLALQGLGILAPSMTHAAGQTLRINEINWAGSADDAGDQWLELVNTDAAPINFALTPYTIEISTPVPTIIELDASYGTLASGDILVIHADNLANSTLQPLVGTTYEHEPTLELPTIATEYRVKDELGTIIDAVSDAGEGIPFKGTAPATNVHAASMSRIDPEVSGGDVDNWYTASTIGAGFDAAAATQYGTPGAYNVELALPTGHVMPHYSTTLATPPTVEGTAVDADQVVVTFTRVSFDPSSTPFTAEYVATVVAGEYSVTATTLLAGRYTINVVSSDLEGNRSRTVRIFNAPASTDANYVVLPDTSVVPAPQVVTPPAITNQPEITLTGTLDNTTDYNSLEVLRNGDYYATFPVTGSSFSIPVILAPNQNNTISIVGVDEFGQFSTAAVVTILHDGIAPNKVDLTKVTLNANEPGTEDSFQGNPGAAEANTKLFVYSDAALTKLLATLSVAADGSFPKLLIGDNKYAAVYLVLEDAAGNRSGAAVLENPTGFDVPPSALSPRVAAVEQNQATITWSSVASAVRYRVMYRVAGGTFSAPMDVCIGGNATCAFSTTIKDLIAGTDYIFAIAAIDKFGNVSAFEEVSFRTAQAPIAPAPVVEVKQVSRTTDRVTRTTTPTPTPTPEATPTPTPTPEEGDVQSAETTARNWTPWIVLGALVAIAVLATAGYFYWFGGEAGAAALASVMAEKARREEEAAASKPKSGPKKKSGGKDKRW